MERGVWLEPLPPDAVDAGSTRRFLQRVLASPQFAGSHQLKRFLEFTVERTLAGRSDEIKEYTLAVEVLGRSTSHDPNTDPIVRTEARRLRRKLEEYYQSAGAEESLRIDYPKGSYVPRFLPRADPVPPPPSRAVRKPAVMFLSAVGAALIGILLWSRFHPSPRVTSELATIGTIRIAVLPFDDVSPGVPDPSLAYAVTDSLNTRLAKIEGLSVAARTSVIRAKERNLELHEIASLLHVDYLVEGSVLRSGEDCRVSAQLVRARDDRLLWAEEYEVRWSDVLKVATDVSKRVTNALPAELEAHALDEAVDSESMEIVESYSRGQYYLLQFELRRLRPHASEAERI